MKILRHSFFSMAFMITSGFITILLLSSSVVAGEDPIPLIDVVVEKTPPGQGRGMMQTDQNGYMRIESLSPGIYVINDIFGNMASIEHQGGPASWRLLGFIQEGKPVWALVEDWSLVDQSDPLKFSQNEANSDAAANRDTPTNSDAAAKRDTPANRDATANSDATVDKDDSVNSDATVDSDRKG